MIEGFEIGHHTADGDGWLTGTTVIYAPSGAVGGVDVRGGGPGTRETDLLGPLTLVERVNAVVLTGGSAYGLAAADGVMAILEARGQGFPVGPEPHQVVPIVPAAVIFDLGRGGDFSHRPDAAFGRQALAAATFSDPDTGCVGAGTGALCGSLKGGFGYAELALDGGFRVAAAVVLNASGSVVARRTGRLHADRTHQLTDPTETERANLIEAIDRPRSSIATTIGVVMTDAALTPGQANKVSQVAHDGMARAINPLHSMLDGDTVFCLASSVQGLPSEPKTATLAFNQLLAGAADVFTDACFNATVSASNRGSWPSYRELAPGCWT